MDFQAFKDKMDVFDNCKACVGAGHGWCPKQRICGGFVNKECSGAETDWSIGSLPSLPKPGVPAPDPNAEQEL